METRSVEVPMSSLSVDTYGNIALGTQGQELSATSSSVPEGGVTGDLVTLAAAYPAYRYSAAGSL